MAGGAQGGGAKPAQGQPQANPQAAQQFQQALQNYRQGAMGMPSQVPGANAAAPGQGMPQTGGVMPMAVPPPQQNAMSVGAYNPQGAVPQQAAQWQGNQLPPEMIAQLQAQQGQAQQARSQGQPYVNQDMMQNLQQIQARPMPQQVQARPMPMPRPAVSQGQGAIGSTGSSATMPVRGNARPQVMGNPNSMPLQRPPTREQQMYQRYMKGRR